MDQIQAKDLDFIIAVSPEALKNELHSLPEFTQVVSIYCVGSRHIAWFHRSKIKKEGLNHGKRSRIQEN